MLAIGIERRIDRNLEIRQAEIGGQCLADVFLNTGGNARGKALHLTGRTVLFAHAGGEQGSGRVKNSHFARNHARNSSGHKMPDGLCGLGVSRAQRLDHDRGRRRLVLGAERALLGKDDMDPCGLHVFHRLDRSSQFALDGAYAGNLLHEGCEAQRAQIIKQFIPGTLAAR